MDRTRAFERSNRGYHNPYFLSQVLARFGALGEVLTDQGGEFQGEFNTLLAQHSITQRQASKEHPQSDGLAKMMV